jgi:hypothetical protein
MTQVSSWRVVRRPSASMRNRPCIARPRISNGLRVRLGEKHIGLFGIDPNDQAARTADRDRQLAADEQDEASPNIVSSLTSGSPAISSRIRLVSSSSYGTPPSSSTNDGK